VVDATPVVYAPVEKKKKKKQKKNNREDGERCNVCGETFHNRIEHNLMRHIDNVQLQETIRQNRVSITKKHRETHQHGDREKGRPSACHSYNYPIQPGTPITPELMQQQLNEIYDDAQKRFKVQIGVGRILRNNEDGKFISVFICSILYYCVY
jgi:hypothetical protein